MTDLSLLSKKYDLYVKKILSIDKFKFKEKEIISAIDEIQNTLKEKMATKKPIEDDVADFSMVMLGFSEFFITENPDDSVNSRLLVEGIWSDSEMLILHDIEDDESTDDEDYYSYDEEE
jgi:hypothetical protein